ncbi:hypothetical protein LAZ67_6001683 [Cordylochernes scorpioides]|uniref:Sulfotransferase n=1 Tax=Cordylochernes scorpioides TaxID=51811 RepID=A0ABY6KMA1_9ARAC|nr:hypothetical protein LAZ67_6001683 [Cordylochernes scorpioides]
MRGHRKRRQFKQTDAFTRGMVIGLKRAGWSIRQIAADTHLGASTVHRLWRRWLEQGNVAIYRNAGATKVTSARVDRRILRQAVAAPQATCTAILQHVQDTLDHFISTRTISRRLFANGLHSCRPLRRLPLTPPNRRQRLEWCRARSTWMTEWHRVVFSDESRFCLSGDSRRVRVWRRRGERSNPAAIVERPTVRQRGIMVWGAIAYDSRSPLLRIQGIMTAQRYVDDVLRPVTLSYLQGVPNALYQQDNARPHTARISQQALQDVQMLPWPPNSPDLSPIEHVWDIIGRRLHALPQPRSEDELWQVVEREWRAIPQDAIRTLIDSLPRRVAACIAVRERMIPSYKEIDGIKVLDVFPTERVHSALQYKPNPNDIFVTSFPKSGTNFTWTLVYLIINKGQPCQSFDEFTRNSPFLEISGEEGLIDIKQPKIIKTHLPFSKIPKSKEAKYIYIARNPKDLVTSYYHHRKSMIQNLINFDQFLNRYLSHELNYGDHIKHILEWYDHRHEQNILMLTYEQVLSDKKKAILEIAKFLDQEVMLLENPDILEKVMKYSSINECRKVIQLQNIIKKMGNKSENLEEDDFQFVRKGVVGDWQNHFSKEQSERLDKIAEERLVGTDIYNYWKSLGIFH